MNNDIGHALGVIAASAFALATLSVIFSQRSQASAVITSAGNAFSGIIGAAVAPVTGGPVATSASAAASGGGGGIGAGFGSFLGGALQGAAGGFGGGGGAIDTGSFNF